MSDELILREAIPDDAAQLTKFYESIQNYAYVEADAVTVSTTKAAENLARIYDSTENNIVLAINDEQIIGFCNIDEGELGIVVNQDFWRFGVGSELMYDTLAWFEQESTLKELTLEVYKENLPAINLYKKFDFVSDKETKDTIFMHKKR